MTWLGHANKQLKLGRTVDGRGLLSIGPGEEAIAWMLSDDMTIRRRAMLPFHQPSLSLTLLGGKVSFARCINLAIGQYCLVLYPDVIELWCSKTSPAWRVHAIPVSTKGKFICFFQMPRAVGDSEMRRFLAITTSNESYAWRVDFSSVYGSDSSTESPLTVEFDREGLFPVGDESHLVSAVDPMGWKATFASDSLDIYTREVLVTLSNRGKLQTWTTNLGRSSHSLVWLNLSTVETDISGASLVHGTSERKVAVGIFS